MYTYILFVWMNECKIEWQRPSHRYQTPIRLAVSSIFIRLFCFVLFTWSLSIQFGRLFVMRLYFFSTKADACQINNLWQLSSLNSVNYTLCNLIALIMPHFIISIPFHSIQSLCYFVFVYVPVNYAIVVFW